MERRYGSRKVEHSERGHHSQNSPRHKEMITRKKGWEPKAVDRHDLLVKENHRRRAADREDNQNRSQHPNDRLIDRIVVNLENGRVNSEKTDQKICAPLPSPGTASNQMWKA
jgi:hypothetical protein